MALFLFAFFLYLAGVLGVLIEDVGEFWLWFLAFGITLQFTLVSLAYLNSKKLSFVKKISKTAKLSNFLILISVGLAAYFRLRVEISRFYLLLGVILILWIYFIFELNKTWRRSS